MRWEVVSLLLGLCALAAAEVRISLDSTQLDGTWTLKNANGSIKANGRVPGGVFSDLEDTGVLKEPTFYRQNNQAYRWVGRENWTYSRNFDLPAEVLNKAAINLVLHGADTIGEVWLNGVNLGNVSNMYTRYVFPIKDVAKASGNSIEVRFTSPVTAADQIFHSQPHWYPPDCFDPANSFGECWVNMLRKMPCSFSWDWAPPLASSGLWKSVEVEATDNAILREITAQAEKNDDGSLQTWQMEITAYLDLYEESWLGEIQASFHLNERETITAVASEVHYKAEVNQYIATLRFSQPQQIISPWWPNGYGEQKLYDIDIIMSPDGDTPTTKTIKFGFRTVEVIQDKIKPDVDGNTFYVQVNGVPVFSKGANWIPSSIYPEKSYDRAHIRHLLLSAKEANMNMFRIWGGGIYESDIFFETADEVGVMILHDFMFSDAIYPVDDGFLSSVRTEVQQQIKRIQRHASIAYWSGNNENESVLGFLFPGNDSDAQMYHNDYRTLYIDTIKKALDQLDPLRYYVGSSPSNGIIEPSVGYTHPDSQSGLWGDSHYYNGGSDSWNPWSYPSFRFISEYGFEGLPSFWSIKGVSEPEDWSISSNFSLARDRRGNGLSYTEMSRLIDYHIPLPPNDGSLDSYQLYIYLSQVTQAMSMKTITEKFRRDRDVLDENNMGRTMGALYWMYNDVWEGPTWASIENSGRWKLLQYYAKKFFSPTLVSLAATQDGKLDAWLVSDLKEDLKGVTLYIMVHKFDTFDTQSLITLKDLTMTAGVGKSVWHIDSIDDLINSAGCAPHTCFIHAQLYNADNIELSENFWFPSRFHDVQLSDANLRVEITNTSTTGVSLRLTADRIAPFVWLETSEAGVFSDNGFIMTIHNEIITFTTRGEPLDQAAFAQSLTIRDLTNTKPRNLLA